MFLKHIILCAKTFQARRSSTRSCTCATAVGPPRDGGKKEGRKKRRKKTFKKKCLKTTDGALALVQRLGTAGYPLGSSRVFDSLLRDAAARRVDLLEVDDILTAMVFSPKTASHIYIYLSRYISFRYTYLRAGQLRREAGGLDGRRERPAIGSVSFKRQKKNRISRDRKVDGPLGLASVPVRNTRVHLGRKLDTRYFVKYTCVDGDISYVL